jgi:hypothetical protein
MPLTIRDTRPPIAVFSTAAKLDLVGRDMIELLLSWTPYGDPPEEDVIGMSVTRLKESHSDLVKREIDTAVDPYGRTPLFRAVNLLGVAVQLAPVPEIAFEQAGTPATQLCQPRSAAQASPLYDGAALTFPPIDAARTGVANARSTA